MTHCTRTLTTMLATTLVLPLAFSAAAVLASATEVRAQNQAELITPAFKAPNDGFDPKHTPKITAPSKVKAGEWFDVTVEIGKEARHPSMVEHHVRYIAIYKNDVELARTYLHPVHSSPKVTYTIALEESATLKAVEEPTHSAAWISTMEIEVEPLPAEDEEEAAEE